MCHRETDGRGEVSLARFGCAVLSEVKSNAIILVSKTPTGLATIGVGPGQTSRVEAVRIASRRAGDRAKGSMMVSDAFFPFRDGIDSANEIGVSSVVQPGGSVRDQESIDAANEHGISMLFTWDQTVPTLENCYSEEDMNLNGLARVGYSSVICHILPEMGLRVIESL